MKRIAEILSKNLPELRVDLYFCNNKVYFGELTFFDGSGFEKFSPDSIDKELGKLIKLPDSCVGGTF